MEFIELFFKMLVGHAIADYSLQTGFMDYAKNRHNDPAKFTPAGQSPHILWPYVLTAHALIHGAAVWWITGSFGFFLAETISHWLIDFGKCDKWFSLHTDQALHILCKLVWCTLFLALN
ncbi:MAG: DUF3307 domain-containing protein [Alphaproteobacteria bacterium]|nr:DUF3307 domain-containing protein [Alphaproteobacteria bacterium]